MDGQAQLDAGGEAAEKKSYTKRGTNFGPIAILGVLRHSFIALQFLFQCLYTRMAKKQQHSFHCRIATNATTYTT